jgi:hypothetical protein
MEKESEMKFVGYLLSTLAKTLLVVILLPIAIPAMIALAIYEDYDRARRMNGRSE